MSVLTLPLTGVCFPTPTSAGPVTLFVFARLINEKSHCHFNFFLVSRKHLLLCFLLTFISSVNFLFKCFWSFLGLGGFSSFLFVQTLHKLGELALYMTYILLSSFVFYLVVNICLTIRWFFYSFIFLLGYSGILCHT